MSRRIEIDGTIVQVGLMGGGKVDVDLGLLLTRRITWRGTTLRSRPLERKIALSQRFAAEMLSHLAAGRIRPVVDCVFPLAQIADAHRRMAANANAGKIVVQIR